MEVVARNVHLRWGELDLICRDQQAIVFVEVRARSSPRQGLAEESLHPGKLRRLRRAAAAYLARAPESAHRFDLVAVQLDPELLQVVNYRWICNILEL